MRKSLLYNWWLSAIGIPFKQDALFWLDGSIEEDAGSFYFTDRTGNGRRFLITSKDFDTTTGFPYKTVSTISAPAGDATLIAADINNFLYTGGVPNAISVTHLFQDIDYEHKLFCRHRDRVTNIITGEEIYEPRVLDIVLYNNVKSGAELTSCQNYYGVPVEATSNVHWISKTGNNSNAGTKVSPWLTINKATWLSGTAGYTVYVKSGEYLEDHTGAGGALAFGRNINVVNIGYVTIRSVNTSYNVVSGSPGYTYSIEGGVIGNLASTAQNVYIFSSPSNVTLNRIKFLGSTSSVVNAFCTSITINKCSSTSSVNFTTAGDGTYSTNVDIQGCHVPTSATMIVHSGVSSATLTAKYNYLSTANIRTPNAATIADIRFNNFLTFTLSSNGTSINNASTDIDIKYNTVRNGSIQTTDGRIYNNLDISNNNITGSSNDAKITVWGNTPIVVVSNNIINATVDGRLGSIQFFPTTSGLMTVTITRNSIRSQHPSLPSISIGDEVTPATFNCVTADVSYNRAVSSKAQTCHGYIVFNHQKVSFKYNYAEGFAFSFLNKVNNSDLTNYPICYNVSKNCGNGLATKGGYNQRIFNNVVINPVNYGWKDEAYDTGGTFPTSGTIFKNNIIIETGSASSYKAVQLYNSSACGESDNNVIYSLNNSNKYSVDNGSSTITLAQWQALGFDDTSTVFTNPSLDSDGVPSSTILIGDNTLPENSGLDLTTDFGDGTNLPSVVLVDQPASGNWQVGAYIQ